VLSFSYLEDGGEDGVAGDVYVSHQMLARDAKRIASRRNILRCASWCTDSCTCWV